MYFTIISMSVKNTKSEKKKRQTEIRRSRKVTTDVAILTRKFYVDIFNLFKRPLGVFSVIKLFGYITF